MHGILKFVLGVRDVHRGNLLKVKVETVVIRYNGPSIRSVCLQTAN